MRKLSLNETKVTDAVVKDLKNLPALRELFLNDTAVTDKGAKELAGLDKLQSLSQSQEVAPELVE